SKADQAVTICQDFFSECTATFTFWGNRRLLAKYRENVKNSLDLIYDQCITQDGQYIILAKLENYFKFITDSDKKLNRRLFDANVRDYLGLNPVNSDILKTLGSTSGPNFWWLNNGITIIGTQAHIVGNSISVQNVQIVNGLQTSESIYNYYCDHSLQNENRSVLVKILISNDSNTSKEIIYATNNQTNVNVTALRATDKVQQDIEDILKTKGIYYERRTNFYRNQGIPENAIISPLQLASGYICLMYKNPYIATSLKQRFMRDDFKYSQVFSPTTDLNVWIPIATLLKKTDKILTELKPYSGSKPTRFLKNYRQIILFLTVARIVGSFAINEKHLINFDMSSFSKKAVQQTINDMKEVDPNCFNASKKLSATFYTSCFSYMVDKYNISAIQAIRVANRKLWPSNMILTANLLNEDILNNVLAKLPPQPWAYGMHKLVAKELNINEMVVSNAINYLIYTNRLFAQVYGYVFDKEGNVVAEGTHFNHTELEARAKLEEQRLMREKKYGNGSF
ncbi:MAG: AIPR family protein, partial [Clostridiales bacterium]|nr:AIPR family protein [Clostridiales bacterium]